MGFERFFLPENLPDEGGYAAVAIFEAAPDQFHVALAFNTQIQGPNLLELRAHQDLNFDTFRVDGPHGLAIYWPNGIPIPLGRLRSIAATCRRIAKQHEQEGLPYSFALESSFEENGEFIDGDTDLPGFTCATFVLAVFEAVGLPLLEADWPNRKADAQKQEHLIREIRPADADDFDDIIGNEPRYRPSEVAGGALLDHHPASYAQVEPEADRIREEMS